METIAKILVTGSSGYIGSHLIKKINNVDTLDITGTPVHKIDIRNNFDINEEYDAIIHLAAKVQVGESVKDPWLYYDTNINGTINVLNKIKTKNFIFASTGAVEYMNCPYAISKKACEEIIQQYCDKNNIPYTIFRFYNVIGSDGIMPTNPDGLFYALVKAIDTKQFEIYGNDYDTPDGTCIRDYVHVNEICNAIIKAIDTPANKIESLGHGQGNSVLTIVNKFKEVNGVDFEVKFVERRAGDIECSVLTDVSTYLSNTYTIDELLKLR
jgi:UDP-glucose 4-epimerase